MTGRKVLIPIGGVRLAGDLTMPPDAGGLVIFAHGSGSSRHSPRNKAVAQRFNQAGLGTLLFDLLTSDEESAEARTRHFRFDIDLLAERLIRATHWISDEGISKDVNLGYF